MTAAPVRAPRLEDHDRGCSGALGALTGAAVVGHRGCCHIACLASHDQFCAVNPGAWTAIQAHAACDTLMCQAGILLWHRLCNRPLPAVLTVALPCAADGKLWAPALELLGGHGACPAAELAPVHHADHPLPGQVQHVGPRPLLLCPTGELPRIVKERDCTSLQPLLGQQGRQRSADICPTGELHVVRHQ